MFFQIFVVILLFCSGYTRHLPRFDELDEEDQLLYRAAYDTPSYNQEEYEEEEDLPLGKLDLLKDGLWAIKAKLKQMKAFDKALVANLLATKLKVKELLENHMKPIKKHIHKVEKVEKKKPYYQPSYPPPQYDQQYPVPQYAVPAPQYVHDPYYGI
ncbi:hypothetical protein K1T71_008719 [Dendrolimus kikuchii]|uniref:Uncharacterized protein n=1 Tax=Dendrolimus kikuchii TaxID=765133 RepID=A0ACC1CVB0_9NEOP|nr:hypothetical protein K1T71_008719 [Dendrolimus kikuchii]